MSMAHHGFLSGDGKCYSFDHRANGYSRGEGVGSVVVKRLSAAIRDGNTIRAVIRGTGVNQDGRTAGITLPSAAAQEALIRDVYSSARLDLKETRMLEAHGTGTSAGDPIEANAAARVFGPHRSTVDPLYVGALKSGIGHLEGGAGVAGIIKSVLVLESGIIPANVNFEKPNPRIPVSKWNLKFPLENTPWPSQGIRRISVNSFGVGGTNAHAILDDAHSYLSSRGIYARHNTVEEPPKIIEPRNKVLEAVDEEPKVNGGLTNGEHGQPISVRLGNHPNPFHHSHINGEAKEHKHSRVFVLSSFDEKGVERNAEVLARHIKSQEVNDIPEEDYLERLAYTLSNHRSSFPWQGFCIADSIESLSQDLTADGGLNKIRTQSKPRLGYVFTGQGAQWYAMGRELLVFPVYRNSIAEATEYMQSLGATWSLESELLASKEDSKLNSPAYSHASCAALQIALVDLLHSWKVVPTAVIGHSSGEIAAAYAAGRLSRRSAWKAAYWRGAMSAKQLKAKGAMLAVGLSPTDAQPYIEIAHSKLEGELVISCFNSPRNITVSGDELKVDALKAQLERDEIFSRKLNVGNAYHSAHMREVAEEYAAAMGDLVAETPEHAVHDVRMFSTVTGEEVTSERLGAQYWVDNMVSPVRFADALVAMCYHREKRTLQLNAGSEFTIGNVLEIGPHGAMRTAVKETLAEQVGGSAVKYLSALNRTSPGTETLLSAVGFLNSVGLPIDIQAVNSKSGSKPKMLVNLPPYSFDHSERVIHEGRLSKNFRLRKHPRHDLFGAPVTDWDAQNPRWRHIIRLSELPWLRDHVVTESYVYPGVGYIIMAIEASRQIADPSLVITGFRLKDIAIKRALIIPDSKEGVETNLSISRMDEASMWTSTVWSRFAISSYNSTGDDWIEHCTGYISLEYQAKTNPIDNGLEEQHQKAQWADLLKNTYQTCTSPVDVERIYDNLVTTGLNFGPLFRNLSSVKGSCKEHAPEAEQGVVQGTGEIATIVTVPDVAKSMPKEYMHSHLIHPSVMDSMFHHFLLSVLDLTGKSTLDSAMVPVFVKEVWLSADINSSPGTKFRGYGKSTMVAYEKYESDILVWDGVQDEGLVSIKGLRATPLETSTAAGPQRRDLCHSIEWTPATELISLNSFSNVERQTPSQDEEYLYWISKLQLAVMLHVTDGLQSLPKDFDGSQLQGHTRRYYDWLLHQKSQLENDKIIHMPKVKWENAVNDAEFKAKLYEDVAQHNGDGALAIRMGANIVPYLTKQSDPLQVMFHDDLLDQVYDEAAALGDIPVLFREYLHHVYHNTSNLRILEIGAGTGASTEIVLESLSQDQDDLLSSRVVQYTFTDVSAGFFEKAKERFNKWSNIVEFKTYNAENDPASQGIAAGTYDLVVAGNVVHTTSDLTRTLRNVRALLKPGGRLLMQEGVRQNFLWSPLAFGQLPGWWQGVEPTREWSPWIPGPEWETHLKASGFDGVSLEFPDRADPDLHTQSLFVATANAEQKTRPESIVIVTSSSAPTELVGALQSQLSCRTLHYLDLTKEDLHETVCLCTLELEREILADPNEQEYLEIRHLLSTAAGVLWVTGDIHANPTSGMILGMMRSIRWERDIDGANLIPLSVSKPEPALGDLVKHIRQILDHQFLWDHPSTKNAEYLLKDGVFQTSRLIESKPPNDYLNSKFLKPAPELKPLGEAGRPVKLSTSAPGMLNKLEFVTDTVYYEPLADNLVEIEIKAVGLNFRDVMIAMGEHMAYSLGNEAAGIVTRVGSAVPDLKPGDRVVYMCGFESVGCFHTYGRVQWQNVVKIPESLSFEVAAGLPCVYSTVIYGLYDIARLEAGETILIHAAAGGIGQAAIQLAKNVGAEIFATVSSLEKKALLMDEYDIPSDHIFSSRDLTFVQGIKRMTNGRGVDVLLNSLSGEALRGSWDIIAPFGRFIEIGKKDSQGGGRIPLEPFLRQAMMASVELPMMMRYKPLVFRRLIASTIRLHTEGRIHQAKPTTVMSYEKVEDALRQLQSGRGMGKIVLVPSPTDIVPIVPQPKTEYTFDKNSTYVLAGGLGGIGRSIGQWMASKGAKHLVFLSRTGKITDSVEQMINVLRNNGCHAHIYACDVADATRVKEVMQEITRNLPQVKGCIQGSMVLRVS